MIQLIDKLEGSNHGVVFVIENLHIKNSTNNNLVRNQSNTVEMETCLHACTYMAMVYVTGFRRCVKRKRSAILDQVEFHDNSGHCSGFDLHDVLPRLLVFDDTLRCRRQVSVDVAPHCIVPLRHAVGEVVDVSQFPDFQCLECDEV